LSEGRWAKVGIDTTGIFEISYERLRELGFPDPERVAVYGSGGVIAADNSFSGPYAGGFAPAPFMHTSDGRILFFAEGPVRADMSSDTRLTISRNFYDSYAYYYLSDKEDAKSLPVVETDVKNSNAETTHNHILLYDRQKFSPGFGGAVFLSDKLMRGQSENYPFSLTDCDFTTSAGASLYCEYGIKISRRESFPMKVSEGFRIEDLVAPAVGASTNSNEAYRRGYISATLCSEAGSEAGVITFESNTEELSSFSAVDFLYIIYRRKNMFGKASELIMNYSHAPGAVEFSGVTSDIEVWNISDASGTVRFRPSAVDGGTVRFETGEAVRLVSFSPSAEHRQICRCEVIDNQDYTSATTPDILIISAPALMEEAKDLANIHRQYQGLDVLVVPQDKIFDEFSEGSRTPMAFRRLAKTLYDKDPSKLKHLILYGSGSLENLLIDNKGSQLVTFQAETTEESRWGSYNYCGDQYFGMLSDNYDHSRVIFQPMLVNVGRISASSPAEASRYNAKVRRFFECGPRPASFLRAVMYSDLGDDYQHFDQNEEACTALTDGGLITVARVDRYFYPVFAGSDTQPSLEITAGMALARGAGYIGYSGHGNANDMGSVIYKDFVDSYSYDTAPFGMFASCETFAFDRGGFSICDYMLEKENGGVLCFLAACRSVVLNYNRRLGTEVARCYAALKPGDTYGDLLRLARGRLLAGNPTTSVCRNTMCYNFGGDPALPVPVPEFGVVLDKDDDIVFTPLLGKTISGYIADANGKIVDDFNGTVEIALHRSAVTRVNLTDTETEKTALDDHDILCNVRAEVAAGRFHAALTVPVSSENGGVNRISMAAVDLSGRCAAGVDDTYTVSPEPASDDKADMTAPEILSAYIDSEEFRAGDIVGPEYVFHAVVDPSPSGLRTASGLERSVKLTLDGSVTVPTAAASGRIGRDGLVYFDIPFPGSSVGKHTISLEVANNVGVKASVQVDFVVGQQALAATLAHDRGETAVARDNIEFTLDGADSASARLLIVDRSGRTVLSVSSCSFPYRWNLSDSEGRRVPDGLYRAWVLLDSGSAVGSTQAVYFTVLRRREGNK